MSYPYDYPPPRGHRNSYHLNPDPYAHDPNRRSSSRGRQGGPAEIHIHNDMYQEGPYADNRDYPAGASPPGRGRSPYRGGYYEPAYVYPPPGPPMMMPAPPQQSSRSRSRGRDDDDYWKNRVIGDYKRDEEARKQATDKAIEERELERKKEEEEAKQAELDAVRKHEQKKKDDEEKQKKAWEEYEEKRKAKEQKEKDDKAKEDEEYKERFRKHMANAGYSQTQIDAMLEREKKKAAESGTLVRLPSNQLEQVRSPVYPKIRRTDIAVETLKFYDLKWKYDETDSEFIIILREMSERETDVLFAHTARLREKGKATVLQIKDKGKGEKPQFVMVRRRSKSRGKSPSGAERLAEAVLRGPD